MSKFTDMSHIHRSSLFRQYSIDVALGDCCSYRTCTEIVPEFYYLIPVFGLSIMSLLAYLRIAFYVAVGTYEQS